MSLFVPSRRIIWFLDTDKVVDDLVANIRCLDEVDSVEAFHEASVVAEKLKANSSNELPSIIVSDMIGVEPISGTDQSVVRTLRNCSPLTMFLLHSFSAFDTEGLPDKLKQTRLIDDHLRKTSSLEKFSNLIERWNARWNDEFLYKMRCYINSCGHADTPYFPDESGSYLSVADIYREIVVGESDIGLEQEKAWREVLDNPPIYSLDHEPS